MNSMNALRRGTVPVVGASTTTGQPIPAGMGGGVSASLNANIGVGDDGSGRGALVFLAGGVVALVLFYLWTHSIQGGP